VPIAKKHPQPMAAADPTLWSTTPKSTLLAIMVRRFEKKAKGGGITTSYLNSKFLM
jgi:hypothetical protein